MCAQRGPGEADIKETAEGYARTGVCEERADGSTAGRVRDVSALSGAEQDRCCRCCGVCVSVMVEYV